MGGIKAGTAREPGRQPGGDPDRLKDHAMDRKRKGNQGMKKILGVLAVLYVLSGCASFMQGQGLLQSQGQNQQQIAFTLDDQYHDGMITIKVTGLDRGLLSVSGITVEVGNGGDMPAIIKWSRSKISQGGRSAMPFLDGMPYEDAGRPAPDERIKASSSGRRTIYPSDNVVKTENGWRMEALQAIPVSIRLCIETGGKERFYTITVDISK
jgi:hypothetical protein